MGHKITRKTTFKMVSLYSIVFSLTFFVGCPSTMREGSIHKAAYKGDLEKVKEIIKKHPAQINVQDWIGCTPLYYASGQYATTQGHLEIVEFLLDHGADIELGNDLGERPLAKAAKFGNYETVKILLEQGAKVNSKDVFGRTPLHEAALWSGKEVTDILLSYGADVSARDEYNKTPLHQAAEQNNIEAAKALVENGGADFFAKDNNGRTPKGISLWALSFGCQDCKELAQYLQMKEDEILSPLESLWGFLDSNNGHPKVKRIIDKLGEGWRFLGKEEYNELSEFLVQNYYSSHPKNEQAGILFDHWGRNILFAGRKINNKDAEWIVWSKGPDGILGSGDDISFHEDTLAPETIIEVAGAS